MGKLLRENKFIVGVIIVLGFLAYFNALGAGMFWDDDDGILNNSYIRSWDHFEEYFSENLIAGAGLESNYWRPLLLISYSIEWNSWKDWAPGYHFINITLHIATAIILFFLLKKIFKRKIVPFWTSLVFLTHPVQTEAVTYVSGRADPLSTLLIFLGIYFYLKIREQKKNFSLAVLIFFALGLMTKEKTVFLFPALLLLVDLYYFYKEKNKIPPFSFIKKEFNKHWPILIIAGLYALLRSTVLNFKNTFNLYNETNPYTESVLVRLATFLKLVPEYFQLMFWPFSLHMERKADFVISPEPLVFLGLGIVLVLLFIVFYFRKSKPHYSFSVAWFLIAMFPVSGIVIPVSGLIWEHYLYLSLIGIFMFLAFMLQDIFLKYFKRGSVILGVLAVAWLIFLMGLTIQRNQAWKDSITFYNDVIKYNTGSLRVWNNLGMAYADLGEHQKAIIAYQKAIELDKQRLSAPPYHNLGNIYKELGEDEKAVEYYNKALEIDEGFFFSYVALANFYFEKKEYAKAINTLKKAKEKIPDYKEFDSAIKEIEKFRENLN